MVAVEALLYCIDTIKVDEAAVKALKSMGFRLIHLLATALPFG